MVSYDVSWDKTERESCTKQQKQRQKQKHYPSSNDRIRRTLSLNSHRIRRTSCHSTVASPTATRRHNRRRKEEQPITVSLIFTLISWTYHSKPPNTSPAIAARQGPQYRLLRAPHPVSDNSTARAMNPASPNRGSQ
jgi:hypothetical protein